MDISSGPARENTALKNMTEAEKEVEANKLINLIDDMHRKGKGGPCRLHRAFSCTNMHRKGFSFSQVSPAECFDSLNLDNCYSAVLFLITCTN